MVICECFFYNSNDCGIGLKKIALYVTVSIYSSKSSLNINKRKYCGLHIFFYIYFSNHCKKISALQLKMKNIEES